MTSTGPGADVARREVAAILERKGHAVDNARVAVERLELAFAAGDLERNEDIDQTLNDLMLALSQEEGQKLGGKSAEAARFITRRLVRLLEDA